MKKIFTLILLLATFSGMAAQQISIQRIDQMPNKPSPYVMRDWKQLTRNYDNFVFDVNKTGTYLPLATISSANGTNYADIRNIRMSTYVGQNSATTAEAINIMPAVVGATLVGVDKTNHLSTNWVTKIKDFFNLKNGQNVYLNNYSANTGHDWWYEIMPNVFFYQLSALYPAADTDFDSQLITIADRQLEVVNKLGGTLFPWQAPNMNYRAFNLLTGLPNSTSVPEPESAGSIAWILYQAYVKSGDKKYLQGAELALSFLQNWTTNPSYEIQLPYGIAAAARMNAEEGTAYDVEKFMNWAFSGGQGTLRGWGCIVGQWGGYDVSGLIGEANDRGNDYAFSMNGFQHAAALAPVVKYDKRYAKAIGKWMLNLANASRLFYVDALSSDKQQGESRAWSVANDPQSCIPFESMKEIWNGKTPFAMGDAVRGGWASTDLSLYSGSSVGYMASIIEKTNVEGILQIDLNKTDFRGENAYSNYLYFNPNNNTETVSLSLPTGNYNIYDAISESVILSNVSGNTSFSIPSQDVKLLVIYPAGSTTQTEGRILKVAGGGVIDYHKGYNYSSSFRIKSFSADKSQVMTADVVNLNCLVENNTVSVSYKWYVNGVVIDGANAANLAWNVPNESGLYTITCQATNGSETVTSHKIDIKVAGDELLEPIINDITLERENLVNKGTSINVQASLNTGNVSITWSVTGGSLENTASFSPIWTLPTQEGVYSVTLTVSNVLGTASKTKEILVKDLNDNSSNYTPVVYYPFTGNTKNEAQNAYDAILVGATLSPDARGIENNAYKFSASSQYTYTPNDAALNFGDKLAVSLWVKPDALSNSEQFLISHGSWEERYKMSVTPEKKVRWTMKTTSATVDVDDPQDLEVGEFRHYTGVFTGYSLELYRNGVLVSFKSLTGTVPSSSKSITVARKDQSTSDYTFKGTIDEVRIYNSALNVNFINQLPSMWSLHLGIEDTDGINKINIYPNPFSTSFNLSFPENEPIRSLEILDLNGKLVWKRASLGNNTDLSPAIASGIYFIKIQTVSGNAYFSKIIKR
ncbi:MAG: LamG-like jellyroll fold domain-containing protein [Dysgonomonas sp.]